MSSRKEHSRAGAGSSNLGTRLQAAGSGPEALGPRASLWGLGEGRRSWGLRGGGDDLWTSRDGKGTRMVTRVLGSPKEEPKERD